MVTDLSYFSFKWFFITNKFENETIVISQYSTASRSISSTKHLSRKPGQGTREDTLYTEHLMKQSTHMCPFRILETLWDAAQCSVLKLGVPK